VISSEENFMNTGQISYDIIFLDLDMPIKNGYQACQDINNFYTDLRKERVPELVSSNQSIK
jgi:CheY-like chemotaxis protein